MEKREIKERKERVIDLEKVERAKKNHERAVLREEQKTINKWFSDNDYIINKIVVGEWLKDDPRYLEYLEQRKAYRQKLDEIEVQLNGN